MVRLLLSSVLALVALSLHAATVTTTLAVGSQMPREVTLLAQRVDGAAAAVELKIAVPGVADVALSDGLWELRVTGDTVWAAPVHVRNVDSATVRVWPTIQLQGTTKGIAKLRAHFTPAEGDGPSGEVDCEVAQETWTCRLPAGRHDLRFSSPGMAPELRYGVSAESQGDELALRFVAGASLYGRVDADTPVEGAEVSLQGSGVQQVVRADRKGYFQFKGVSPGEYSVSARKQTLVAPRRSVKVLADAVAELREPLRLDTPKRLTILLMPPLDPDGETWRIRLASAGSPEVLEERIPETGDWSRAGLVAGSYHIRLVDAQGGLWKSQTVTLDSEDRIVAMPASGLAVAGRVMLGGRGLQARLSFGGEWGRVLQADEDGRFAGQIPFEEGERQIFVQADTPYVNRSVRTKLDINPDTGGADLLLELPGTTLMGHVLNEDRSPARGFLRITGVTDPDAFEHAAVESDGSFQVAGLEPGSYRVVAEGHERQSDVLKVDLAENETREIEIVLKREELLRGKMTIGDRPVIDAKILAIPRDAAWSSILPTTTTNERGLFELRLPPGTRTFDGIAVHPAFDTVMARGSVRPDRVVWVQANQIGGTLVVHSQEPHEVLLLHKGAELPVTTVASLSGGTVEQEQVTLTRLEPGEYALCSFDKTSCASGYLPPHGSLTLTKPRR